MLKKMFFVCLALFLLTSVLFAEGQGESANTAEKKITAVVTTIVRDPDGTTEWAAEFSKLTGAQLNLITPPHNDYPAVVKKMFATGEIGDVIEVPDFISFAKQGALLPLDSFIAKSAAAKNINPDIFKSLKLKDGKIYGFPVASGGGCVTYIRKDWLDKLGLKVPTTWDEFYAVLKAFTEKDPDGNGQKDTFGYTLSMDVPNTEFDYYNRFFMLDARFDFLKKNNKWVDGFTEPEMVKALERFRTAYKDGVIDSEFFTNKTSTMRTKLFEGRCGVYEYWSGIWAQRTADGVKAANPNGVVIPIAPIKGAYYIARQPGVHGIYAKAKNPEFVWKTWFETLMDKGAGQTLFVYGVKGLHYDVKDGKMAMLPLRSNPANKFDKAFLAPELQINGYQLPIPTSDNIALSREIHMKYSIQLPYVEGDINYATNAGEIWKVKQQMFAKMVIGDLSIADGIQQYKEKVKELKYAEILKELNS